MSDDFKRIIADIHDDAKDNDDFMIEEETDTFIAVWDNMDDIDRRYTITDTDALSEEWLSSKIIITPSADKEMPMGRPDIVRWIMNHIPKENYQTLNKLIFIYDDEADFDWLYELFNSNEYDYNLLEVHNLPDENQLGINWYEQCCAVVNIKTIKQTTRSLITDEIIEDYEYNSAVTYGLLTTIAHEIRHIAQANPYINENIPFENDPEEDAENFAQDAYYGVFA